MAEGWDGPLEAALRSPYGHQNRQRCQHSVVLGTIRAAQLLHEPRQQGRDRVGFIQWLSPSKCIIQCNPDLLEGTPLSATMLDPEAISGVLFPTRR